MNPIAVFVKEKRKAAGLIQREFALRSGLGLRFVRELEQGKETSVFRTAYVYVRDVFAGTPTQKQREHITSDMPPHRESYYALQSVICTSFVKMSV